MIKARTHHLGGGGDELMMRVRMLSEAESCPGHVGCWTDRHGPVCQGTHSATGPSIEDFRVKEFHTRICSGRGGHKVARLLLPRDNSMGC